MAPHLPHGQHGVRASAPAGHGWRAVVIIVTAMTLVQAIAALAVLSLPAVAPEVARAFELSPSLIGYQVSVIYLGGMLTSLFGGQVARRLGGIGASQLAMGLAAAGGLIACLPSLAFLALGSFVIGLCYGLTNPAASQLLAKVASARNRNLIFSIKQTGVPLGGVVAGLVAPRLALEFGWQAALAFAVVLALTLACALLGLRRRWDDDREPRARLRSVGLGSAGLVWRLPALRALSGFTTCYAALQLCVMTYVVTLLVSEARMPLIKAGVALAVVQTAGVTGRIFWGWFADRWHSGGVALLLIAGFAVAAAGALTQLSPAWPDLAVYAVLAVLGATGIGWNGVAMGEVMRLSPPGTVSMATGGILFFSFAGVLVGPAGFSLAYQATGSYALTFGGLALLGLAGALCVVAMRRLERAAQPLRTTM
ncbi:MAG: MFS transporter [Alphaproteobacteria bacterium]|nr:MFS transporter [Alphaproteobacteria bacterium]